MGGGGAQPATSFANFLRQSDARSDARQRRGCQSALWLRGSSLALSFIEPHLSFSFIGLGAAIKTSLRRSSFHLSEHSILQHGQRSPPATSIAAARTFRCAPDHSHRDADMVSRLNNSLLKTPFTAILNPVSAVWQIYRGDAAHLCETLARECVR